MDNLRTKKACGPKKFENKVLAKRSLWNPADNFFFKKTSENSLYLLKMLKESCLLHVL